MNEIHNSYLQPKCEVIEIHIEQIIAASEGQTSTETLTEEDLEW